MKNARILSLFLCLILTFSLMACGGSGTQSGVSSNAGSAPSVGGSANVGSSSAADTPDDGNSGNTASGTGNSSAQTPSIPTTSEPLDDFLGIWFMMKEEDPDNIIHIGADGTWGTPDNYADDLSQRDPEGSVAYNKGVLTISSDGEVISFRDKDGKLVCEQDGRYSMIRMQDMFEPVSSISLEYIGYWKYDEADKWLVIGSDATWYQLDADGKRLTGGYIYRGPLSGGYVVLIPDDYEHLYLMADVEEDDGEREMDTSDDGSLHPVDTLPNGAAGGDSGLMGYFVGLWQTVKDPEDRSNPCVYIREDGTYTTLNKNGDVIAQGQVAPGANRQIMINADGSGDVTWTLMEEGTLFDGAETAMVRLSGNGLPDAEDMKELVGSYANWDYDKILTLREDGTWMIRDKWGSAVESGVVSKDIIDDYNSDVDFTLVPDSETYPIILDSSYNDEYGSYDLVRLPSDEIPDMMQYVGLWKWDYHDKTALVRLVVGGCYDGHVYLEGAEVDADGNVASDFDYSMGIYEGKLLLEGTGQYGKYHGFRYEMHLDSDGCLCNLQNEKILTPVG